MPQRVGIFIDGPNLYAGARTLLGDGRIDIPRFVRWAAAGRQIVEACYWSAQLDQSVNPAAYAGQRRFFAHLERTIPNGRVGRASLQNRGNGRWVEKGVDVGVALDLVVGAYRDAWDVGILVSGDGDLARAAELACAMGKSVEVVCCVNTLSRLLAAQATRVKVLDTPRMRLFAPDV